MRKILLFIAVLILIAGLSWAGPKIIQENSYDPATVAITGGTITGITDLAVPDGGTGVSTLSDGGIIVGAGASAVEVVTAGATTEILVGGGAATNPVWTAATGTGAPVRSIFPAIRVDEVIITSSSSITANQVSGTLINNFGQTDDVQHDLPTAAEGYNFKAILGAQVAKYFRLRAAPTNKIYLDGTAGAAQGYIYVSGSTTGYAVNCGTFQTGAASYDWACVSIVPPIASGTPWTAGP